MLFDRLTAGTFAKFDLEGISELALYPLFGDPVLTIFLLTISNIFMTFAWYGHLKYRSSPIVIAILVSWGIAFFEYCFQVPANRIGSYEFSTVQLKTIQEIITLVVFCFFSYFYLNESIKVNQLIGFVFLVLAAFFIFKS